MEFNIESLRRKMLVKYPFFGSVIANTEYIDTSKIETAATDGKKIYFNKDFMEKLSTNEQVFILSHEVCHIAFNHINRGKNKDHEIWNIATDAIINASLKRDGLKLVEGSVDMDEALDYDAEEFYKILLERSKQNKNKNKDGNDSSKNNNNSNNDSNTNDNCKSNNESNNTNKNDKKNIGSHSLWEKGLENDNPEKQESSNEKDNKTNQGSEKIIKQQQEKFETMGEKETFKKNGEFRKEELEKLKEEITKKSINHGTSSQGKLREVDKIGKMKPLIDWRYVLKETLNYDLDWSYKNATLEDGVVSANLEEQPIPVTEILLDTSGSVSTNLLKNFLRECKNIMQTSRVKVGCFDTKFYGFNEIRTNDDIEDMKFRGGGGTDFNVAVHSFTRRVENKIIFTDGEADMPKDNIDVIWIVFGNKKVLPNGGKVINITGEQLDKLYDSLNYTNQPQSYQKILKKKN